MRAIKNYDSFETIQKINKGWSSDEKYFVKTRTGDPFLLRIADVSMVNEKQHEISIMKQFASQGLPIAQPVDIGLCNDDSKVYTLTTWCDGEDAADVLPTMTDQEQYELGIQSGEILKDMHRIPAPKSQEDWEVRFNRKVDRKIKDYVACGIEVPAGEVFIQYLNTYRHLLKNRPQTFQHGDYHTGNMVISNEGKLSIIDFNRNDYGDPWEEFNRIVWSAEVSPHFATGQLNGYFNGDPPLVFFQLLAFYICSNTLSSIPWAIPFGEEQVDVMKRQMDDVLLWFDGMDNPVPSWYITSI